MPLGAACSPARCPMQAASSTRSATQRWSSPGAWHSRCCRAAATVLGSQNASSAAGAEGGPQGEAGSDAEHSHGRAGSFSAEPAGNDESRRDCCASVASRTTHATRSDTATSTSRGGQLC